MKLSGHTKPLSEHKKKVKEKEGKKQGRIHGNPVADVWAGAVVRKPLGIQKCYVTDGPTDRDSKV